jgi:hypothetical protein
LDAEVFPDGRYLVNCRTDRTSGIHGGVLIASSTSSHLTVFPLSLPTAFEFVCSSLFVMDTELFCLVCLYNPPADSRYRVLYSDLVSVFNLVRDEVYSFGALKGYTTVSYIYCGDFNMPSIDWGFLDSRIPYDNDILELFSDFNLEQLVEGNNHLLDLVLTDCVDRICSVIVIPQTFSDHFPIIVSLIGPCPDSVIFSVQWAQQNNLKFNIEKLELVIFKYSKPPVCSVYVGNHVVSSSDVVKDLGVLVSSNLSWVSIYNLN